VADATTGDLGPELANLTVSGTAPRVLNPTVSEPQTGASFPAVNAGQATFRAFCRRATAETVVATITTPAKAGTATINVDVRHHPTAGGTREISSHFDEGGLGGISLGALRHQGMASARWVQTINRTQAPDTVLRLTSRSQIAAPPVQLDRYGRYLSPAARRQRRLPNAGHHGQSESRSAGTSVFAIDEG